MINVHAWSLFILVHHSMFMLDQCPCMINDYAWSLFIVVHRSCLINVHAWSMFTLDHCSHLIIVHAWSSFMLDHSSAARSDRYRHDLDDSDDGQQCRGSRRLAVVPQFLNLFSEIQRADQRRVARGLLTFHLILQRVWHWFNRKYNLIQLMQQDWEARRNNWACPFETIISIQILKSGVENWAIHKKRLKQYYEGLYVIILVILCRHLYYADRNRYIISLNYIFLLLICLQPTYRPVHCNLSCIIYLLHSCNSI